VLSSSSDVLMELTTTQRGKPAPVAWMGVPLAMMQLLVTITAMLLAQIASETLTIAFPATAQ